MTTLIVSLANSLGKAIAGLERAWLCRQQFCQAKGIKHLLLVQLGNPSDYDPVYLQTFGTVIFLGQEGVDKATVDVAMRDVLSQQLAQLGRQQLLVINDDPHYRMPKTWHYLRMVGVKFCHFIHYDVLETSFYGDRLGQLRKDDTYLVCNPAIEAGMRQLGFTAVHVAPAVFTSLTRSATPSPGAYCLVANQNPVKRVAMALSVFAELEKAGYKNLSLTIFGQLPQAVVEQAQRLRNVRLAGSVLRVPYGDFVGLISCSVTEAFSNSVIEASGWGGDLLLSRNRCHQYYLADVLKRDDALFSSQEELYALLVERDKASGSRVDSLPLALANTFSAFSRRWEELLNVI